MSYETLLLSHAEGVARITLNRPEVRNAPSRTLVRELDVALAAAEDDPETGENVLSGAVRRPSARAPTSREWAIAARRCRRALDRRLRPSP